MLFWLSYARKGRVASNLPLLPALRPFAMRVRVHSVATGDLLWECVNGSLWQARGWELRMWMCGALNCRQYFSLILIARQLLLCDMAFVREYAEADTLTVYVLRRTIADPSDVDLGQAAAAIQQCNRLQLWTVLSRGVHMRVTFICFGNVPREPPCAGQSSELPRGS